MVDSSVTRIIARLLTGTYPPEIMVPQKRHTEYAGAGEQRAP